MPLIGSVLVCAVGIPTTTHDQINRWHDSTTQADHTANFTRHQRHGGDWSVWKNFLDGENTGSEKSASTVADQEMFVIGAAFN
jgi:hypothetical protein